MKAILKFDLPDEEQEFNLAIKGKNMFTVLWNLDQYLGRYSPNDEKIQETYGFIREKLHDIMYENNISFDEIK